MRGKERERNREWRQQSDRVLCEITENASISSQQQKDRHIGNPKHYSQKGVSHSADRRNPEINFVHLSAFRHNACIGFAIFFFLFRLLFRSFSFEFGCLDRQQSATVAVTGANILSFGLLSLSLTLSFHFHLSLNSHQFSLVWQKLCVFEMDLSCKFDSSLPCNFL